MDFDAIVVGSGINGLSAAVHLASRGWKVAVVEKNVEFGGAVKTSEATLPGFRHDMGAMNLSMFAGSPFYSAYGADLRAHGLELSPVARSFASVFRDGTYLGVHSDEEETRSSIADLSAPDAEAWVEMGRRFADDAPLIFGLLNSRMPSFGMIELLINAVWRRGFGCLYELARLLLSSPRAFLDRHFAHPKVKTMMAAWGMHLDFAPDVAGGALFPYLESMANQAAGMVIGKGGADTVISAMVALIRERGGEMVAGTAVASIEVKNNRAVGVRLGNGRQMRAKRAVIANLHPRILFGHLLRNGDIPAEVHRSVEGFRSGPGTMMIHLATSQLPAWTGGAQLREFAYVHVAPDMAMMSRAYAESMDGLLPGEPVLVVGQPTAIDPSRAPAGRHILWIQVRPLPTSIRGDAAGLITGRDWTLIKEVYADRIIRQLEAYAPGFGKTILSRTVVSPLDLERDNPNLIGGDSLSGSHHLDQSFFLRPWAGASRYRTPVKGLHMCGASCWPGAGTGGASGYMLAQALAGKTR